MLLMLRFDRCRFIDSDIDITLIYDALIFISSVRTAPTSGATAALTRHLTYRAAYISQPAQR
jgi:hypothetical protein